MNQIKTGRFIATCRKEQKLTQAQLAEMMRVSDRAVSKWETGKSMPDTSIMLELCNALDINVNELLTGERITMETYKETAEKNLLDFSKVKEEYFRELLILEYVIGFGSSISFMIMIFTASFTTMPMIFKIGIITAAIAILLTGLYYSVKLEHDAGYYKCPHCGHKHVPTMITVLAAPHIFRNRKLTCPECGKRGYHKKVISK